MTPAPATSTTPRCAVLIVGVGGQGLLSAARFLGDAAVAAHQHAVVGQLHGMSQRGGSVQCTVVFGDHHGSQLGPDGARVVLGFEALEVLRALPALSPDTTLVLNSGRIVPFALAFHGKEYPDWREIVSAIDATGARRIEINGPALAAAAGDPRTLNVVMLGAAAGLRLLPVDAQTLANTVAEKSARRFADMNRRAFTLGMEAVAS